MFHFGMPTLLELDGIEENVKMCQALGLEFLEINMNVPEFQVDALDISQLRQLAADYGIYYTFHMADNLDIGNFQKEVRDVNVALVKKTLTLAEAVASPSVNMHMQKGVLFTLPHGKVYIYDKYLDRYLGYVKDFGDMVSKLLVDKKVRLAVENTGDFDLAFIKDSTQLLINHQHIHLTYDIGHDFSNFGSDKAFMMKNLAKIKHMHIHDAEGTKDHLILGQGQMQLEKYLGFAKNFDIRCVIETKTIDALRNSVEVLPQYFERFE